MATDWPLSMEPSFGMENDKWVKNRLSADGSEDRRLFFFVNLCIMKYRNDFAIYISERIYMGRSFGKRKFDFLFPYSLAIYN